MVYHNFISEGHVLHKYPKDYFVIKSGHGKCVTISDCDETYDDCNGATFIIVELEDCQQTAFSSALSSLLEEADAQLWKMEVEL